jgi:hypothetical protein
MFDFERGPKGMGTCGSAVHLRSWNKISKETQKVLHRQETLNSVGGRKSISLIQAALATEQ